MFNDINYNWLLYLQDWQAIYFQQNSKIFRHGCAVVYPAKSARK